MYRPDVYYWTYCLIVTDWLSKNHLSYVSLYVHLACTTSLSLSLSLSSLSLPLSLSPSPSPSLPPFLSPSPCLFYTPFFEFPSLVKARFLKTVWYVCEVCRLRPLLKMWLDFSLDSISYRECPYDIHVHSLVIHASMEKEKNCTTVPNSWGWDISVP